MARLWRAIIIGLALATAFDLASGPTHVEGKAPGEAGSRDPGSRIAAGIIGNHTCAVKEDGTVFCWGSNAFGQLGNGSGGFGQFSSSPVQVNTLNDAVALAAGTAHTCALRANGTVVCWGSNEDGRLGDGTTTTRFAPVAVLNPDGSALVGVAGIAVGETHSCAVRVDGTLRCWGARGNLGAGNAVTAANSPFAVPVVNLTDAVSVATGRGHTCALRVTGGVACWGNNFFGQLGLGFTEAASIGHTSPVDVPGLTDIAALAAGGHHTCALRANGLVRCWGNNTFGQIGDGTFSDSRSSPTPVLNLGQVVVVALGFLHSCARRVDGDLRCWGRNNNGGPSSGQLGDLTTTNQASPVTVISTRTLSISGPPIVDPLLDAEGLAAGERHSCALQVDDKIRCWGANDLGQLGRGDTNPQTFFAPLVSGSGGTIGARAVAAGVTQACARRADGTVACWDSNLTPAAVSGLTRTLAVAVGAAHKCALRSDGLVLCMGANNRGQIGNGTGGPSAADVTDPAVVQVSSGPLTDVAAIAAGDDFTCALRVTGSVRCWGANDFAQLGNNAGGFQLGRFEPMAVLVQGVADAIAVAAGRQHACALRVGGTVHCWGLNTVGQAGAPPANTIVNTPFQVTAGSGAPLTQAVAIGAGPDHSCALLVKGTAKCWGKNDAGQLGNNTVDFDIFFGAGKHPVASDVENLSDAVAFAGGGSGGTQPFSSSNVPVASSDFTCARGAGGTVRCWGANGAGQLGDDGAPTGQRQPQTSVVRHVAIFTGPGTSVRLSIQLSGVSAITAGDRFGCGLVAAGQPFCWGSGTSFARLVASFAFNIDPNVALTAHGRVARVTVLANCPAGQQLQANATLTQASVSGHGIAVGACTGALERYEAAVSAHGQKGFKPGAAAVEAEAIIRDRGQVVDVQEWTRKVELRQVKNKSREDDDESGQIGAR